MQQLGNEFITLISRWLHIMWNFSIVEITRLLHTTSNGVSVVKLLIVLVLVALIGWLFVRFAAALTELLNRLIGIVVYAVLALFLVGTCAWGINMLWQTVPDVVALH
jgi:hypothetical protein